MYGYIYKTTNKLNNKIYIGQKKSPVFLAENYLGSGKYLLHAINKYGKENFTVEMIDTAESREELSKLEIMYIDQYNTTDKSIGYNIAKGGIGGGEVYVNNGFKNEFIPRKNLDRYLSEGWQLGMLPGRKEVNHSATRASSISKSLLGRSKTKEHIKHHSDSLRASHRHWYTTGVVDENLLLKEGDTIPEGYYRGKTVSEEFKKKISSSKLANPVPVWNKGLTKETDKRVASYAESLRRLKCISN